MTAINWVVGAELLVAGHGRWANLSVQSSSYLFVWGLDWLWLESNPTSQELGNSPYFRDED
jgi:hypothetical protein